MPEVSGRTIAILSTNCSCNRFSRAGVERERVAWVDRRELSVEQVRAREALAEEIAAEVAAERTAKRTQ